MKKGFALLILFFIIIISIIAVGLKAKQDDIKVVKEFNKQYEEYLGKQLYGTDVTTIINKAIDNNTEYEIQKDSNGMYINDNKYCIKIELNMITVKKTYQMEQFYKAGLTEFVRNFNLIVFECSNIEYHKETGRVSKIVFNQLEE